MSTSRRKNTTEFLHSIRSTGRNLGKRDHVVERRRASTSAVWTFSSLLVFFFMVSCWGNGVEGQYWNFPSFPQAPFTAFGEKPASTSGPVSESGFVTRSPAAGGHHNSRTRFDHIVIGAGILGSWTAYHLASRGKSVLLLEQFPLPHSRGSSMGQSRGIELASTDENWIPHLLDSYPWWRRLEEETGENLFEFHDLLIVTEVEGGWPVPQIDRLLKLFRSRTARVVLDPQQVRKYYPDLRFKNTTAGFVDGSGGILLAAKILDALRGRIKLNRGVIRDQCQVTRIDPGPPASVLCRGHADAFSADSLIITAGPWTSKILKRIGMDVKIQSSLGAHMYFPAKEGASIADISFIHYDSDKRFRAWTHPVVEYPGLVKLGVGLWIPVDPDRRDMEDPRPMREAGLQYVKEHLTCLNETMAIYETCMYYHIEDKRHIISPHPYYENIIVGAAAGSGFKIAPVIGLALADLAMKRRPSMDVTSFSLDRFSSRVHQYYLDKHQQSDKTKDLLESTIRDLNDYQLGQNTQNVRTLGNFSNVGSISASVEQPVTTAVLSSTKPPPQQTSPVTKPTPPQKPPSPPPDPLLYPVGLPKNRPKLQVPAVPTATSKGSAELYKTSPTSIQRVTSPRYLKPFSTFPSTPRKYWTSPPVLPPGVDMLRHMATGMRRKNETAWTRGKQPVTLRSSPCFQALFSEAIKQKNNKKFNITIMGQGVVCDKGEMVMINGTVNSAAHNGTGNVWKLTTKGHMMTTSKPVSSTTTTTTATTTTTRATTTTKMTTSTTPMTTTTTQAMTLMTPTLATYGIDSGGYDTSDGKNLIMAATAGWPSFARAGWPAAGTASPAKVVTGVQRNYHSGPVPGGMIGLG